MPPKRKKSVQDEITPQAQIDGYAFNTYGWAIKIPDEILKKTSEPIILNAYDTSSTMWEKAANRKVKNHEIPWRDTLSFSDEETNKDEADVRRYLLVGLALRSPQEQHLKKHEAQKEQNPVGTFVHPNSIAYDENDGLPLLVVTPIQEDEATKVDLFVLLRPKFGLCTPYHIGAMKCFFLPIFRNMETGLQRRQSAWNKIVARVAFRPSDKLLSNKQMTCKKTQRTAKVNSKGHLPVIDEICMLAECYVQSRGKDVLYLKEIQNVLEQASEDLTFMKIATKTALRKFVDNTQNFADDSDEGDGDLFWQKAEQLVVELVALWPDLEGIATIELMTLKQQLWCDDLEVEYRLIRPFVAEGCYQLRKIEEGHDNSHVASEALDTVRRVMGPVESVPLVSAADEVTLLPILKDALKKISQAAKEFDSGLKNGIDGQTVTGTLQEIWDQYASALDTDAAKLMWMQAAQYMPTIFREKQRDVADLVDKLVLVLEKMGI